MVSVVGSADGGRLTVGAGAALCSLSCRRGGVSDSKRRRGREEKCGARSPSGLSSLFPIVARAGIAGPYKP